jgi:ketosteroid isomerase-like protein
VTDHISAFLSEWTTAERAGDTEKLATLLTDDFYGVGPLGFLLPRQAWMGRHGQGLVYEYFGLEEVQVRLYGDIALVAARNNALGTFQGHPLPEALRATLVIRSDPDAWRLAAIHMSFMAGTQGSPPLPPASDPAVGRAHTRAGREGL